MDNIEMSRDFFIISYDGKALRDHAIDVRTLTPTLLAASNLVREANKILNGEDVKVKQACKKIVADPLNQEGIDTVEIRNKLYITFFQKK